MLWYVMEFSNYMGLYISKITPDKAIPTLCYTMNYEGVQVWCNLYWWPPVLKDHLCVSLIYCIGNSISVHQSLHMTHQNWMKQCVDSLSGHMYVCQRNFTLTAFMAYKKWLRFLLLTLMILLYLRPFKS